MCILKMRGVAGWVSKSGKGHTYLKNVPKKGKMPKTADGEPFCTLLVVDVSYAELHTHTSSLYITAIEFIE